MVFAVNAPASGNTFSAFLQNAQGSTGVSGSSASASGSPSTTNAVSVSTGSVAAIPKPTSNGAATISPRGTGALLALSAVALAHALL